MEQRRDEELLAEHLAGAPGVFDILADPWFVQDTRRRDGEDAYFYRACKASGIRVWCDTDLTFGHIRTTPLVFK